MFRLQSKYNLEFSLTKHSLRNPASSSSTSGNQEGRAFRRWLNKGVLEDYSGGLSTFVAMVIRDRVNNQI